MSIYAFEGEVITCTNGHPYARFKKTVRRYDVARDDMLEMANGTTLQRAALVRRCSCGADAIQFSAMRGMRAFIGGQWRSAAPSESNPLDGTRLWDNS